MFNVSIVRIKYARSTIGYSEVGCNHVHARKSFDKCVLCNTLALISGATPFSPDITVLCSEKRQHSSSMYLLTVTFYCDQSMIINSCGLRRIFFSVYGESTAGGAFPPFF